MGYPAALAIWRLGMQLAKSARDSSLLALARLANRHPAAPPVFKPVKAVPIVEESALIAKPAKFRWRVLKQLPHALSFYVPKNCCANSPGGRL
jgi:hypothetical protein